MRRVFAAVVLSLFASYPLSSGQAGPSPPPSGATSGTPASANAGASSGLRSGGARTGGSVTTGSAKRTSTVRAAHPGKKHAVHPPRHTRAVAAGTPAPVHATKKAPAHRMPTKSPVPPAGVVRPIV